MHARGLPQGSSRQRSWWESNPWPMYHESKIDVLPLGYADYASLVWWWWWWWCYTMDEHKPCATPRWHHGLSLSCTSCEWSCRAEPSAVCRMVAESSGFAGRSGTAGVGCWARHRRGSRGEFRRSTAWRMLGSITRATSNRGRRRGFSRRSCDSEPVLDQSTHIHTPAFKVRASSRWRVHLPRLASHWTTSSSAEWSLDKPPSSFVKGHESTMWDIVWVSATGAQVQVC